MRKFVMVIAAVAALGLLPAGAEARSGVKVGVLSCGIAGGVGLILGSSKRIDCVYQPTGGGRPEHYSGRINKIGVDIGITNQSVVVWAVFAPGKVNRGGRKSAAERANGMTRLLEPFPEGFLYRAMHFVCQHGFDRERSNFKGQALTPSL